MRRSPLGRLQPTGTWVRAVAAVAVVAAVALVAIYLAGRGSDVAVDGAPTTVATDLGRPEETADQFLTAWSSSDWATVRRLVSDQGTRADEALADWWRDLKVASVEFTVGEPQIQEDSAIVPIHRTVEIEGIGTWDYDSTLHLSLQGGGWAVIWSPDALHPRLRDGDRIELTTSWATRGLITDKDGRTLVQPVSAVAIGLIPERIVSRDDVAAALEETLAVPRTTIDDVLGRPGVQPDWFLPISTISREDNVGIKPILYPIPGIAFRLVESREPVASRLAAPLLGTTGEVTAEQLAALGTPYAAGLVVGQSGLERSFERQLAGSTSTQVIRRSSDGSAEVLFSFETTMPADLQTTLAFDVQRAAESALSDIEVPASIVVIDAPTGEIRAAASTPSDGFSRATSGLYPPGSTFKIIVAAALLEDGLEPTDTVSCPRVATVAGKEFGNAVRLPATMTFEDAFARSCNTAFIQLAADLEPNALTAMASRFGFGKSIDIGIAAADAALQPSTDPVQNASSAIGQGEVLASPLNMASVAAAAASGSWRPPTLVAAAGEPTEPFEAEVLADLHDLMRAVVTRGTGSAAAVEGMEVAGKTGTAQIVTSEGPDTVAWFVGFAGDLAFAVNVEGGESGGATAGPIAAAFLEAIETNQVANGLPDCVAAGADWVTFQGDITRAGCSRASAIVQPRRLWQADVGISGWLNSPIVVDDTVVVGSAGTRRSGSDSGDGVYALDLQTGRQRWYFPTNNDVNGVTAHGEMVVATGDEGLVWGLSVASGTQLWSFSAEAPVFTNPLIAGDLIVVGDASGVLWGLNLDGTERWRAQLDGAIRGGASSDGKMVFAVSEHGETAAFTVDGFEMWRSRVDHLDPADGSSAGFATSRVNVFAAPTVVDDKLIIPYIVGDGPITPAVVALDRFVGTMVWRGTDPDAIAESFANVRGSPARHGDTVVVAGSLATGVQGFDSATGQALWETTAGTRCERQWASPVVVSDLVLLPRPDGALHTYDAENGELVWRIAPASPSEVATLALCESDGQQIQDGFDVQATVAIAPDGTIIVASTSQLIYAIGDS